ncbi:MAG: class I SAM-dependent methyltransferase [Burkholderiales bacterium]|jgi:SAM-dependent methyltransferase|nr:class I SAM-dependent methyltransferase [Burkholderiales bacterium]
MPASLRPKPFSEACERNREPILAVLARVFADRRRVLEIGSGTGQHAVAFGARMPWLVWQPSDVPAHLDGIRAWVADAACANVRDPIALDVNADPWPVAEFDAAFSANTAHIMSAPEVERMFARVARALAAGGDLALYGPFNYAGRYTSESNERFDASLRSRDAASGIRDFEWVDSVAAGEGFALAEDNAMPANNRLLVWRLARARRPMRPGGTAP